MFRKNNSKKLNSRKASSLKSSFNEIEHGGT